MIGVLRTDVRKIEMTEEERDWVKACEKATVHFVMNALLLHLEAFVPRFSAKDVRETCLELAEDLKVPEGRPAHVAIAGYEASRRAIMMMTAQSRYD